MNNMEICKRLSDIEQALQTHSSRVGQRLKALESAQQQPKSDDQLLAELVAAKHQLALQKAYLEGLREGIELMKQ